MDNRRGFGSFYVYHTKGRETVRKILKSLKPVKNAGKKGQAYDTMAVAKLWPDSRKK